MTSGSDVTSVIGQEGESCPNCRSDNWKSAKMIVLEGTTFTKGEVTGNLRDPGAFSGGVRAFFVSDRWFSWDKKLDTDVELTTTSGLVLAIKKLMVEHGPPSPKLPREPVPPPISAAPDKPKIGFFERIRPIEPKHPTEPMVFDTPADEPWYAYFFRSAFMTALAFGGGLIYVLRSTDYPLRNYLILAGSVALAILLYSLVRSFGANERVRRSRESVQAFYRKNYEAALKKYQTEYSNYELDCQKAAAQERTHEKDMVLYREQLALFNKRVERDKQHFAEQLAKYEEEKNDYAEEMRNVVLAREQLWERARVCLRCGTAYQSTV